MTLLPVPKNWNQRIKSAILHALSLARSSFTGALAELSVHRRARDRILAENERLKAELRLRNEELRLKDARMGRVPARRRPHYSLSLPKTRTVSGIIGYSTGPASLNRQSSPAGETPHAVCE